LTEPTLRDLPRNVFEIGAHTLDHVDLTTLAPPELDRQLIGGRVQLEDLVGRSVSTFAYPWGRATPQVVSLADAVYSASCSTRLAPASPDGDRAWLPRIDAYYLRRPRLFAGLGTRRVNNYFRVRRTLREWRDPATGRPMPVGAAQQTPATAEAAVHAVGSLRR
jgi:peptidoglycan/xylan/chitin deacetylase (PgdA/CDA1 family)